MRVSETGRRTSEAERRRGAASRFGEALRRAARDGSSARRAADGASRGTLARRTAAAASDAAPGDRREALRDDVRALAGPRPLDDAAPPALRALARALPPVIDAWRLGDGAPLTLSFGRSLGVELRAGAAGVEIVLRPDARLVRACETGLPALVAALRRRGVAVARAAVRSRAAALSADPRVDAAGPLR